MVFYSKNIQTDNGKLITGYACDSRTADAEFLLAKRQYIAATGRVRGANDVIAYHVRQSFRPGEITLEEANRLGVEFARRFTKENHAFVVCTHIDKAGYSKKFLEEHEEEILLHQAAKNAFDEMGVKKLPKVKELQTEYAKLLEEKKKTYAEYRRSREEMLELLTAKANIDRVLKMAVEQDVEKEKDHGKR